MRENLRTVFAALSLGISVCAFSGERDAQCEKDAREHVQRGANRPDATIAMKNLVTHYNRRLQLCLVTVDIVQLAPKTATSAKPKPYYALKGMINVTDREEVGGCLYFQEVAQVSCGMYALGPDPVQKKLTPSEWNALAAKLMRE